VHHLKPRCTSNLSASMITSLTKDMGRVGENEHIYGVRTVFLVGNHQVYGHIQCKSTVLANSRHRSHKHMHISAQICV